MTPNVLLIILDSTRARNCSLYGYDRKTTPFLETFADDAVLFEQCRAPGIHSIASHTSIFTGYQVEEHQITNHKSFVEPDATIWHQLSADHNYETGLFSPNVIVTQTSNLADSFDTCVGPKRANFQLFDDALAPLDIEGQLSTMEFAREAVRDKKPVRSLINGIFKKLESRGGAHDPTTEQADVYVDEFLDWINDKSGPWAACVNLMDTHTPFEPTQEYDQWSDEAAQQALEQKRADEAPKPFTDEFWTHLDALEPLYDGTIRQADAAIKRLVAALSDRGLLDETLVVVTSDHGEALGERSKLDSTVRLRHHSWGIGEVLTHVPLLVKPPNGAGGYTIKRPVSLTQFPAAVEAALDGGHVVDAFVSDDDVLASTYRIRPPGDELDLPEPERTPYFGPWRAVYCENDNNVIKHARRGEDAIKVDVSDAQMSVRQAEIDDDIVKMTFDSLQDVDVSLGAAAEREIEEDVADRLADLGYLR